MTTATPKKLKSGDWGALTTGHVRQGDSITITTKSGKSWTAKVAKVIWSGSGKCIVATESRGGGGSRYTWQQRENMGDRFAGTQHEGVYCGFPCPVSGMKCCPKNGPCHDCE